MKWTKFTLETTTEAVDLVSDMLSDLGIEGIEISDKLPITEAEKKQMFVDILPDPGEDDGIARVSFYQAASEDAEPLLAKVKEGLKELSAYVDAGSGQITAEETDDKDWLDKWKEFFKPFRIDDTIVIKPTWERLTEHREGDLVIELDPGSSFGTGSHETTKLCIQALKKYVKPDSVVLDAGSGSGILSIVAKKLGAEEVLGIDIDPNATVSSITNSEVNQLQIKAASLSFMTGNIIEDNGVRTRIGKGKYDVVVANILADVIVPLSDVIGENLKSGGIYITSGIIDSKEEAVRQALLNNGFDLLEVNKMGDWVSFVARK